MNSRRSKRLKTWNCRITDAKEEMYKTVGQAARANRVDEMRRLIDEGHPVDAPDNRGWMPIHEVANNNNVDGMQLLLRFEQTNVNWLAHDQTTALLLAVNFKETICSKLLIDHGADVNQADHMDETPLHRAAEKGNAEQAHLLLTHGANVYCRTYDNMTPMDKAIISNSPSIVASILQSEAFVVNSRDHIFALIKNITATTKYVRSECLKCLLEHIINKNNERLMECRAKILYISLYAALRSGMSESVRYMLESGVNPNEIHTAAVKNIFEHFQMIMLYASNESGAYISPLHTALEYSNDTECLKLLLPLMDKDFIQSCFRNPFILAMSRNSPLDVTFTQMLIDSGLNVNHVYNEQSVINEYRAHILRKFPIEFYQKFTAMFQLCCLPKFDNQMKIMYMLLAAGAYVNPRLVSEASPILPALEKIKLGKILIEHGANLNVYLPSVVGNLVVMSCANNRLFESLKMVLYAGAEVDSLFEPDPVDEDSLIHFWKILSKNTYIMQNFNPTILSLIVQFAGPIHLNSRLLACIHREKTRQKLTALADAQFSLKNICRQTVRRIIGFKRLLDIHIRWNDCDYVNSLPVPQLIRDYIFYKNQHAPVNIGDRIVV